MIATDASTGNTIDRYWRLILSFLRRDGFGDVAEDVASDIIASMIRIDSGLLQEPPPTALPMCIRQQARSRAVASRKKARRWEQTDDNGLEHLVNSRAGHGHRRSERSEVQLEVVSKVLGPERLEKLLAECQGPRPKQKDLARAIGVSVRKWRSLEKGIQSSYERRARLP
jgi:hypothetical protein